MLVGGVILGLVVGLLVGGRLDNLLAVRLRWIWLLFLAVVLRYATEFALGRGIEAADTFRVPLFALSYGTLSLGLWLNRRYPGMTIALVGVLLNGTVILANGGHMPIWEPSLLAAGYTANDISTPIHVILPAPLDGNFLLHLGAFGDIFPIPFDFGRNVASIGDIFLAAGLAFFLFAAVVRRPGERDLGLAYEPALDDDAIARRLDTFVRAPETGLRAGLAESAALERPMVLGGSGAGVATPALTPSGGVEGVFGPPIAVPGLPPVLARVRRHPYVRLALNGSFSALWVGQVISFFGDRVHQIALASIVYGLTGSALALSLVFVAATLPNLVLGPLAGTLVDRWDQKQVLVVSDLLRAAAVLLIPIAAVQNIVLVYPLVFLITSISIFFRPARTAILPRIVRDDELVTANSASWIGETAADVLGYPAAGFFVAFLGSAVALAFWFDAATYVASAVMITTMSIPPVRRVVAGVGRAGTGIWSETIAGWRFLRSEPVLLANTLQAVAAQFTIGVTIALALPYAGHLLERGTLDLQAAYGLLEAGIGVGNLIGGFIVGLIGSRIAKGPTVIIGYVAFGACTAALALTGNLAAAIGLMFGIGVANMVFVIPSQTLFMERTPRDMLGRVVGLRFSVVFGSMTVAMAMSGLLAETVGIPLVLATFGLVSVAAGLAGLTSKAVRSA